MTAKERSAYLALIAILLAASGYFGWRLSGATAAATEARQAVARLEAENQRLNQTPPPGPVVQPPSAQPAPSTEPIQPAPLPEQGPTVLLSARETRDLTSLGLTHPVDDLVASLRSRSDLIPAEGILGGKMAWNSPDRWVITPYWVLAQFDDGHVLGYALLSYDVKSGGNVDWKLMDWKRA